MTFAEMKDLITKPPPGISLTLYRTASMFLLCAVCFFLQRLANEFDTYKADVIRINTVQLVDEQAMKSDREAAANLFRAANDRIEAVSANVREVDRRVHDDYALKSEVKLGIDDLDRRLGKIEGRSR